MLIPLSISRLTFTLGSINYAPLVSGASSWTVHATSISVNGQTTAALKDLTITIDSSVPNMLAPFSVTNVGHVLNC